MIAAGASNQAQGAENPSSNASSAYQQSRSPSGAYLGFGVLVGARCQQRLHHLHVARLRQIQRTTASLHSQGNRRDHAIEGQKLGSSSASLIASSQARRHAASPHCVLMPAALRGHLRRSIEAASYLGGGLHLGAFSQQRAHHAQMALARRHDERRAILLHQSKGAACHSAAPCCFALGGRIDGPGGGPEHGTFLMLQLLKSVITRHCFGTHDHI